MILTEYLADTCQVKTGQVQIYRITIGKVIRQIIIDEFQWCIILSFVTVSFEVLKIRYATGTTRACFRSRGSDRARVAWIDWEME